MPLCHLDLLNVVLAWRFTQPGWPAHLARHRYLVHGIGVTIPLPDRNRFSPDVLASKTDVTLIIEVKSGSGSNLELDQLGRMESCTAEILRDFAHLHIPNTRNHQVGIVYVCNEEHAEGIVAACENRASVIGFNGSSFSVAGAPLPDSALAADLGSLSVARQALPLGIIPFDQETPLSEVAATVIPEVVAALVSGAGQVTTDGILQRTHALCHDIMKSTGSGSEQGGIRKRVAEVLRTAATEDFQNWLEPVPGQPIYRFRSALANDQASRTRELKALQKSARELIARFGGSMQLSLGFEDS